MGFSLTPTTPERLALEHSSVLCALAVYAATLRAAAPNSRVAIVVETPSGVPDKVLLDFTGSEAAADQKAEAIAVLNTLFNHITRDLKAE